MCSVNLNWQNYRRQFWLLGKIFTMFAFASIRLLDAKIQLIIGRFSDDIPTQSKRTFSPEFYQDRFFLLFDIEWELFLVNKLPAISRKKNEHTRRLKCQVLNNCKQIVCEKVSQREILLQFGVWSLFFFSIFKFETTQQFFFSLLFDQWNRKQCSFSLVQ